ncbi:MAG TPA: ATP-binding protein [Micromonospora sp.]
MSTALAEHSWCVVVPHHGRGARMARQRLSSELADIVSPSLLADVIAVVAEFVGNSVLHARPLPDDVIRVAWQHRVDAGTDVVEVRVTDGGAAAQPRLREAGPDETAGRGLQIVAALASRWGVERDASGQSVWAELCAPAD